MNIPPDSTARFISRLLFTVMNLTDNCGCASTPMPTPATRDVTTLNQRGVPAVGIEVHPVKPMLVRFAVCSATPGMPVSCERSACAFSTPPSIA